MREYGQIQCSFWRDPDIRGLNERSRTLAAYLLTGPHSNGIGCYYLHDGYITADFGWQSETISECLLELASIGFCRRCSVTHFVLIPKFLYWNPISNGNVAKAREKEFEGVPKRSEVYGALVESMKRFGKHWSEPFRDHLERVSDGSRNQNPTLPEPNLSEPTRTEPPGAQPAAREQTGKGARKLHGSPEDEAMGRRIFAAVRRVVPSAKEPSFDAWANAIRLMREQDERTHEQIWTLFDFANRDNFWRTNILSPATLREKWTQLEAKRIARGGGPSGQAPDYTEGLGRDGTF